MALMAENADKTERLLACSSPRKVREARARRSKNNPFSHVQKPTSAPGSHSSLVPLERPVVQKRVPVSVGPLDVQAEKDELDNLDRQENTDAHGHGSRNCTAAPRRIFGLTLITLES